MHEYGERERSFVSDFSVARLLLQVHVSFKPEPGPGAESLVQVDHLGLILARQAFVFGKFHPFGVSLEFAFCAGHVVTQLQNDDAQKFGHALGLGCLFGGEEFLFGKHEKNVEKVIKKLGRSSNKCVC